MDIMKGADKTLYVLEYILSHQDTEFSVTCLAKELGYSKTVMHRILQTLLYRGYLSQNEQVGCYTISPKLMELGSKAQEKFGLLEVARPHLKTLNQKTGETVNIGVLTGVEVTYLDKIDSTNFLRTDLRVGTRVPAYCSALGKALFSFHCDDSILDQISFQQFTDRTITDRDGLKHELANIKMQGYALDNEEYIPGVRCLAVPIGRGAKAMPVAISVAGPTFRLTGDRLMELVDNLKQVAVDLDDKFYGRAIKNEEG